jgi:hypothetical protein
MADESKPIEERAKVFLRRRDGLFYGANGIWTENAEAACDFEDAASALVVGRSLGLSGVEIVIRAPDGIGFVPITGN